MTSRLSTLILAGCAVALATAADDKPIQPAPRTFNGQVRLPPAPPTVKVTITLRGGGGGVQVRNVTCTATDNEFDKICTGRVPKGTPIVAQRTMLGGVGFGGWGGPCSGQGVCTLDTNADIDLSAKFSLIDMKPLVIEYPQTTMVWYIPSVSPKWGGKTEMLPLAPGQGQRARTTFYVRRDAQVDLTAQVYRRMLGIKSAPATSGWSGACAGTVGEVCHLTMSEARTVSFP